MVVVCESCSTRFRIDEARIPATGRQVRCSQCKATFVVAPANPDFDDVIDEVVAEVTDAGGTPLPEPTADLFAAAGGDLDDPSTRPEPGIDEERWEFDDAPALALREREPALEAPAAAALAELEPVGDPTEWDLLRDPAPTVRSPVAQRSAEPFLEPAPAAPAKVARAERWSPRQFARLALSVSAWLALVGIGGASIATLLVGAAGPRSPQLPALTLALSDGEARAVEAGFVENALTGSLFVIQGQLARPGADARLGLRAYLVDDAGARIGPGRWAGVAPAARALRERAPEALRSELDASAAQAALGGSFVAFFEELPLTAARYELALEPLPEPPVENEPEAPPEAEADAGAPTDPTASSSPARRPSSG